MSLSLTCPCDGPWLPTHAVGVSSPQGVTLGLGWLPGEVPTFSGGLGEMLLLGVRVWVLVWSGGSVSD